MSFSSFIFGQTTDSLRLKLDQVFQNVDKNQIPTGFLQEYVAGILPWEKFDGVAQNDSNIVSLDLWNMLYASARYAKLTGTNLPDYTTIVQPRIEAAEKSTGDIELVALAINYAYLRPDAVSKNLLRIQNNQLYDVANRTQSPYLQRTLFVVAPTRSIATNGQASFVFKPDMFFNTTGKTLSSISVCFGDSDNYTTPQWNSAVKVNYSDSGRKRLKFKFYFTDGTSLQSHSDFEVRGTPTPPTREKNTYFAPADEVITIPAVTTGNRQHAGGTLNILFHQNRIQTRQLIRPFFILEGFDPSSIAPNTNIPFDTRSLVNQINQPRLNGNYDFNDQLDRIGEYDLVFLDYNNGSDDIVRNANLFEDALDRLNARKRQNGSNEQNVVLGISMGGLVSRYGLARMTKERTTPQNPNPTETRLLFTQDSPHQGANTPLGMQHLVRAVGETKFFGIPLRNEVTELRELIDMANSPASQQQLIIRSTNHNGGFVRNTWLNDVYRPMITFSTNQPQPTYRFNAISSGSQCGQPNFTPHTELIKANVFLFLKGIPISISAKVSAKVNSLPEQGETKEIVNYSATVLFYILGLPIPVTLSSLKANNPTGEIPWDGLSGGTAGLAENAEGLNNINLLIPTPNFILKANTSLRQNFCFVPVVSALDLNTVNREATRRSYIQGITASNISRASRFIAQEQFVFENQTLFNNQHYLFTARNAQWIFNEMHNGYSTKCKI